MNKYLPLSFLVKLDKPFSEYPEVKKKILQINNNEYWFDYIEDYFELDKGSLYAPFSKDYLKLNTYPIISVEEFMAGEYLFNQLGEIGDWFVYYDKEKGIITAGCQTVTLAEMRQIKNQLNNNTVDRIKLESGSFVLFYKGYRDENSFRIRDGEVEYIIKDWEFEEIYEKLKEV